MRTISLLCAVALLGLGACSDDSGTKKDTGVQPDHGVTDTNVQPDAGIDAATDLAGADQALDAPPADLPAADQALFGDQGAGDTSTADAAPSEAGGPPPSNDTCAAPKVLTWTGATITESVDTANATNDIDLPNATSCTGDDTSGPDVFYSITLPPGTYEIELPAASVDDPALYVLTSCSTAASACVAGSDNLGDGVDEDVTLTVTSTTTYIIGVDSFYSDDYITSTLTIKSVGPAPDGGVGDASSPDAILPADAGPPSDGTVTTGSIVITEFLADPSAVGDSVGEWVELYNAGSAAVNLKNWTIKDQGTDSHKIASDVVVQPGAYVVLGASDDTTLNGNVAVAYKYPYANFQIGNTGDEIEIYDPSNTLIDSVVYTAKALVSAGASWSLKSPSLDNSVLTNWCAETTAWATGSDKGTPGKVAGCP